MSAIFLVIKGNREVAEGQCIARKICYTFDATSENHNEVYGYAEIADMGKVISWYTEDSGWAGQLSDGSLLWYSERAAK
jgi:hypothetical protein